MFNSAVVRDRGRGPVDRVRLIAWMKHAELIGTHDKNAERSRNDVWPEVLA